MTITIIINFLSFQEKKRKIEPPIPTRVGKKKKSRGPEAANRLPQGLQDHCHVIVMRLLCVCYSLYFCVLLYSYSTYKMSFENAEIRKNKRFSLNGRRVYTKSRKTETSGRKKFGQKPCKQEHVNLSIPPSMSQYYVYQSMSTCTVTQPFILLTACVARVAKMH